MSITIISAGLQTTVQGAPYRGQRHIAIPAAGAADPLALALANRLVAKPADALALEITMSAVTVRANCALHIALAGAAATIEINGQLLAAHQCHEISTGDLITILPPQTGTRSYLAFSMALNVPHILDCGSTCLTGQFGGLNGRALKDGDVIPLAAKDGIVTNISTPLKMRPVYGAAYLLRVVEGPEFNWLEKAARKRLYGLSWRASHRMNRIGLALDGMPLKLAISGNLASGAVFPGTLQCPSGGQPFLLGVDGQTCGGYPRIAQVIRADRHLIGQIRPGDSIQFTRADTDFAHQIYTEKLAFWRPYLPDLRLV